MSAQRQRNLCDHRARHLAAAGFGTLCDDLGQDDRISVARCVLVLLAPVWIPPFAARSVVRDVEPRAAIIFNVVSQALLSGAIESLSLISGLAIVAKIQSHNFHSFTLKRSPTAIEPKTWYFYVFGCRQCRHITPQIKRSVLARSLAYPRLGAAHVLHHYGDVPSGGFASLSLDAKTLVEQHGQMRHLHSRGVRPDRCGF